MNRILSLVITSGIIWFSLIMPGNLCFAEEARLCSWNIRIFSDKSRDESEMKQIAFLLNKCDIAAVQEVRDEKAMQRVLRLMDPGWKYIISEPVGRMVKERYAFFYRSDRINLKTAGILFPDTMDRFIREPYFATFKAQGFDFTLVTTHSLFGTTVRGRQEEARHLAGVLRHVAGLETKEKDIILLGDFNLPPTDQYAWGPVEALGYEATIHPPVKTTITDTSLYDNFWFDPTEVQEYTGEWGMEKFDEWIFKDRDDMAEKAVSDHRPIWIDLNIDQTDDD